MSINIAWMKWKRIIFEIFSLKIEHFYWALKIKKILFFFSYKKTIINLISEKIRKKIIKKFPLKKIKKKKMS